MTKLNALFATITTAALFLGACSGTPTPEVMMKETATPDAMLQVTAIPDAMMKDTDTPDAMMMETATPDAMMSKDTPAPAAMMEAPAWYGASLTDAATGKVFSINELKGKVVLVETLAQWCSNCKLQQAEVKALHEKLGMQTAFVSIGLDIDPNENIADLKNYVSRNNFDWLYAVAPADVSREIAHLYGDQFLNPPSTPILIIDRHGIAHPLPFGLKSADDLYKVVNQYLTEGM